MDTESNPPNPTDSPKPFSWWPHTRNPGIVVAVLLVATFWQASGGFLWRLYITVFAFFFITGVRYGWWLLTRGNQPIPKTLHWQNPGYIAIAFCVVHYAIILPATKSSRGSGSSAHSTASVQETIAGELQVIFNAKKQELFELMHPVGTAKSVKVHDVSVRWKEGHTHNTDKDIEQFTVRFTVYWQGPITSDGYTKATQTYDAESERWVGGQILGTNGVTKSETFYLGGYVAGSLLREWLNQ